MGSGEPIRVAITVGPAGHGGIATYCSELIAALSRRNDVELVLIGAPAETGAMRATLPVSPSGRPDRPRDVVVRGPRTVAQLRVALLSKALRRRHIDLVHVTRLVAPLRWPGCTVMTFHDDYPLTRATDYDPLKRRLLPPIFRRSMQRAAAVVTLNAEMAERATRHMAPGTPVVDAGAAVSTRLVAAGEQRPRNTVPPGPFAVVVGDAGPRKGVDVLVRRWSDVTASRSLRLVLIGARAASDELLGAVRADPMITVASDVSDGELAWWYRHAEVVLDPSAEEGFGFPRVEAAHFSTPYLSVRSLSAADDWVEALVALGRDVANGPDVPRRLDATETMTWDEVAQRTVGAYRSALASGSR